MYFKKLELFGFKSFLEKTTILFEPGVTAIVGPNGCGKSNIADAIRWVLGEQSAKSLRGSSMEDIIFNGSEAKEPLNLAEVSVTFSNESKILPIEYDEVTITRRLYRSGDSEYLINRNIVRLKDIQELLMGTGIGTESYSLIEQGKMDIILNSKPEDRRAIFEEAAGITKFKSKKNEALRKLEQTESNLLRVNDILQEVKRQIGSMERQARKAENYKVEFEKLKDLELAVALREFILFEDSRKSKEGHLEALKNKEEECLSDVQALEGICDQMRERLAAADSSLNKNQEEMFTLAAEIQKSQDRVFLNHERINELAEKRGSILKQAEYSKKRIEEFGTEYQNLLLEFEEQRKEETEGLVFLSSVETQFNEMVNWSKEAASREEGIRKNLENLTADKAASHNELTKFTAEIQNLARRRETMKNEEAVILKEVEELQIRPQGESSDGTPKGELGVSDFQAKLVEFKNKLKSIFKALFERQQFEPGPGEEEILDREIRAFSEEVYRIRAAHADSKERLVFIGEQRKKLEGRLTLIQEGLSEEEREETGHLERKRHVEEKLQGALAGEKELLESLLAVQNAIKEKMSEREAVLIRVTETRSKQGHLTARREKIEKDKNWVLEAKLNEESQVLACETQVAEAVAKKEALEVETVAMENELERLGQTKGRCSSQKEVLRQEREQVIAELDKIDKEREEKEDFLKEAQNKHHTFQLENMQILHKMDRLKERMFNTYQVDLIVEGQIRQTQASADEALGPIEPQRAEEMKVQIQAQRDKLNKMGPVNLVAIQEYNEMKERFDFLSQQEQDLTKSKEDLHQAILKINRTTRELFAGTFENIQRYFVEYFKRLFEGGSAELVLLDEEDILESGIEIVARPPGKKLQNISLLSGGEKALTAVALLFSLFRVKPSPFCVLDEIDAPLDESNVDRFCAVLKEFIAQSQFILITHNKRTMNLADALYGITMAETGISKLISVRFSEKAKNEPLKNQEEVLV